MVAPDYFAKHYVTNRDKILDYKKDYYYQKIKYRKQFQNIKLKGLSKNISNHTIKSAINNISCFILANNTTMTPQEFYDQYSIKDFSIIEIEYELFNDYELTMKIPIFYLTDKIEKT
tara:strand:+ start:1697 stop:2047 length:351 start_codon:yes stop_codon:yes gene_type:complete